MSTFGPPGRIRETPEEEQRQVFREKVARSAQQGRRTLSSQYSDEDLAWAFRGHEDELQALEREAVGVGLAARQRRERAEQGRALVAMTDRVESEMLAAECADRRAAAHAEARRRLGITEEAR